MSNVRTTVIVGVAAALTVAGGGWTYHREGNSPCSDRLYVEHIHEDIREEMLEESEYLAALDAGAVAEGVSLADRETYAAAAAHLREQILEAEIVGRLKHPNNRDLKNCHLSLTLNNPLADFDLGQRSTLGVPIDRKFEMITRFEIRFNERTGVELFDLIERQRNQVLVNPIEAGQLVESERVAGNTRLDFTLEEPEFLEINYATSVIATEDIEAGFFGER